MKRNSITVAIPTFEAGTSLIRTLNSIYDQTEFELIKEVLLLLDGKEKVSEEILSKIRHRKLKVISSSQRLGQASKINLASRLSDTELLILTNDDVVLKKNSIENIFKTYIQASADLITTRALPDSCSNLLSKALYSGQKIREQISENYRNGDNYMSCNGRLIGLSKKMYKDLEIPASVKNNDAYIYLYSKGKKFKHIYSRESVVYYSLPKNLEEHINQSNRFQKSKNENQPHFSNSVSELFSIPLSIKVRATIKEFISQPFYFLIYLYVFLYTRTTNYSYRLQSIGYWETDKSTKRPISIKKICFWGSYDPKYSSNKIIRDGLKKSGVEVIEINIPTRISALNNNSHLKVLSLIKRVIRKFKLIPYSIKNLSKIRSCDYIWVGYPGHFDIPFAWLISKITGVPIVFYPIICLYITFTEDIKLLNKNSLRAKILKGYESIIYRIPVHLFTDAPFQAKVIEKIFSIDESKITSIPVGADDTIYKPSSVSLSKNIRATYYGLYSPLHGVEHIIESANLTRANKHITYHMIGNGQMYLKMRLLAEKYKLKNLFFYPNSNESNSKKLFEMSDIFFGLLSDFESNQRTIGNKAYQGLALGKVVINANTAAARHEFMDKCDMYLVNQADARDIAAALTRLQKDIKLRVRIAKNGYKTYLEKYTPKMIGEKIIDSLSQITPYE